MREEQREVYDRLKHVADDISNFTALRVYSPGGVRGENTQEIIDRAASLIEEMTRVQAETDHRLGVLRSELPAHQTTIDGLRGNLAAAHAHRDNSAGNVTLLTGQTAALQNAAATAGSSVAVANNTLQGLINGVPAAEALVARANTAFGAADNAYANAVAARGSINSNSYYYSSSRSVPYQVTVDVQNTRMVPTWSGGYVDFGWQDAGGHVHWEYHGRARRGIGSYDKHVFKLNHGDAAYNFFTDMAARSAGVSRDYIRNLNYSAEGHGGNTTNCGFGRSKFAYPLYRVNYEKRTDVAQTYTERVQQTQYRNESYSVFNQAAYDNAVNAANTAVNNKLAERATLQNALNTAQANLASRNQAVEDARAALESVQNSLNNAGAALNAHNQAVQVATAALGQAQNNLTEIEQRITETEEVINQHMQEIAALEVAASLEGGEVNNLRNIQERLVLWQDILNTQEEILDLIAEGEIADLEAAVLRLRDLCNGSREGGRILEEEHLELLSYIAGKFEEKFAESTELERAELLVRFYGNGVLREQIALIEQLGYDLEHAAELAFAAGNIELLQELASGENSAELLVSVVRNGRFELAQRLVDEGADIGAACVRVAEEGNVQIKARLLALEFDASLVSSPEEELSGVFREFALTGAEVEEGLFGVEAFGENNIFSN